MVNLLFISNSTKIDTIKSVLQPFLKVKIDTVADFDYGLKDVFEKRPATVFIQDQIAGVTGESVARHIQMLLGSSAPSFIFMHEGSPTAKPIKGLFEYLIDLSQADVKIVADIQAILKSLLGPQWEKIYIPSKMDKAAIRDSVAVPEGSRALADQLVDDFLSDLDCSGSTAAGDRCPATGFSVPVTPADEPFLVVSSTQDQLTEMLSETRRDPSTTETTTGTTHDVATKKPSVPANVTVSNQQEQQTALPKCQETVASVTASVLAHPADFIIGGERPAEDVAPDGLLHVFEENYYSHSGGWKRYMTIAVVLTMCIGSGIWYLLKQKPYLLTYISKPSAQPVVVVPATRPVEPAITIQKTVFPPAQKTEVPALPTFILQAGLDHSFALLKPGWERYVDTTMDYRVYRPAGKIKALQVLAVNNHDISEPKLKSILIELVGDGEYRVKSREKKLGFNVSRAIAGQKAELLIYRKKSALRAFVVSLD